MGKKDKKMGANKASILKASLPAHLANRIVNIKVKKPKKKDWMAFNTQADCRINAALLQAFQDSYAEEKAKADDALAKLFIHKPDPEHTVQFVGPKSLEKVSGSVQPTATLLEVQGDNPDNGAEFSKMPDGGLHVRATMFADINLTAEQFAAFKQWVMEN